MGSDGSPASVTVVITEFQSTLPHGERPKEVQKRREAGLVSIHAPAWGATCAVICIDEDFIVSIHAPAWGATP